MRRFWRENPSYAPNSPDSPNLCLVANRPLTNPYVTSANPWTNHCVALGIELLQNWVFSHGDDGAPATQIDILFVSAFATSQPRFFVVLRSTENSSRLLVRAYRRTAT